MNTAADRVRHVHKVIAAAEADLRRRWPILDRQDAIGLGLWSGALLLSGGFALAYLHGTLPALAAIALIAMAVSILHELEHDLIHNLYFKAQPWVQTAMFTGIWMAKNSLNPWTRRMLHLRHHRISGQLGDVEERLLGLGSKGLLKRIVTSYLPFLGVAVFLPAAMQDAPDWVPLEPGLLNWKRWRQRVDLFFGLSPLIFGALALAGKPWAADVLVCWIAPNLLRHGCIALLSSYSHYYGDIAEKDVTVQNQILRHWALLPLQIFACDFGATHIIHHYYVQQPFYVRHFVRREAWRALEEVGTRVNDFGIVARANRYNLA